MAELEPIDEGKVEELIQRDDASLAEAVQSYNEAYKEEFTEDDVTELRKRIVALVPEAEAAITDLLNNASSESVRFNVAKYVMGVAYGKKLEEGSASSIEDLVAELRKND